METETHRRERFVQGIGVIVALLLFSSFFLPRSFSSSWIFSSSWSFGWDGKAYEIIRSILQLFFGLLLAAMVLLPLPRLLKGLVLSVAGILLTGLYVFESVTSFSQFFESPLWLNQLLFVLFGAVAASLAFHADSDRDGSARQALGLLGGSAMLLLATLPLFFGIFATPPASTAFIEIWSSFPGSLGLLDVLFLCTVLVVLSAGPIAGALLMGHSALAIVRPQLRLLAAGPIAAMAFLLWPAAVAFLYWLAIWADSDAVFSTYFVLVTPSLGSAFLLAGGVFYVLESLALDPERAASVHPGLGVLVLGSIEAGESEEEELGWPPRSVDVPAISPDAEPWSEQPHAHGSPASALEPSWSTTASAEPLPSAWSSPAAEPLPSAWSSPGVEPSQQGSSPEAWAPSPPAAAPANELAWIDEQWRAGQEAWAAQDWDRALHHLQQVVQGDPQRTEAVKALADIYYGLGQVEEAERYYHLVLQAWPDNEYSRGALAQIEAYRRQS
ncbi:MAG: tetratricopeptide repeat protein [Myxococcota bacterium]|jgi:tetratricopeptide (TPR) repeat protein|nr:tetratricopeptide repeat protein [Myxococcota bacterium]